MSADIELLRLAAKAAGIKINEKRQAEREEIGRSDVGLWTTTSTNWNPIADDGDALRLAVKLGIELFFINGDTHADGQSEGGPDKQANTRRAIVRAAAAIGRAIP